MKNANKFNTFLAITGLLILSAQSSVAGVKEGGGLIATKSLYECLEKNPVDSENPIEAVLTEEYGGRLLLQVGTAVNDPRVPMLYSNSVIKNNEIRCIVACEIFENQNDQVTFSATTLTSSVQGQFTSPQHTIDFVCEKKQN